MYKVWEKIRPMFYSALFLFISSLSLQLLGSCVDSSFNLLASRGTPKIIFTLLVIAHVMGLALTHSRKFFQDSLDINVYFLWKNRWIPAFLCTFSVFFSLHVLMLCGIGASGYLSYNSLYVITPKIIGSILFGFLVTFFLAWTEELIFRGIFFRYVAQSVSPLVSVFIASLVFMLAHDIVCPWNLFTSQWQLGLGLFLLGMMLNMLFLISGKLYVGMGAHAGLVFVKVILRRIPLVTYLPSHQLPWWLTADLRQSHLTHALFVVTILILLRWYFTKSRLASVR